MPRQEPKPAPSSTSGRRGAGPTEELEYRRRRLIIGREGIVRVVGSAIDILLSAAPLDGNGRPSSMATATEWLSKGGIVIGALAAIEAEAVDGASTGLLATGRLGVSLLSVAELVTSEVVEEEGNVGRWPQSSGEGVLSRAQGYLGSIPALTVKVNVVKVWTLV